MKFKVIEHPKYNLQNPSFNVDYDINPKNDQYPFKHLTSGYRFIVLCGRSGSGKTSLLVSLVKSKKVFNRQYNNCILFMPSHSRNSLEENIFEELAEEKKFDTLDYNNLSKAYDMIKEYSSNGENNLLILDDCASFLKDHKNTVLLYDVINNKRHYHTTVVILVQTYYSIPKELRRAINDIVIFKPTIDEMYNMMDELLEMRDRNKIDDIHQFIFDKKHNYMVLDIDSQRLYKNNIELLYKESDKIEKN